MADEKGNLVSLLAILMMLMTLLTTGALGLAQSQLAISRLDRETSNSYHLARSGAEKMVDAMNKELEKELPKLIRQAWEEAPNDQYKIFLTRLIYHHIDDRLIDHKKTKSDYQVYSDVRDHIPISITARLYNNSQKGNPALKKDLKNSINRLALEEEVGRSDLPEFAVEVVARAVEGPKTTLVQSRVIGTIKLLMSQETGPSFVMETLKKSS